MATKNTYMLASAVRWGRWQIAVCLTIYLVSCFATIPTPEVSLYPPSSFSESSVVGTWTKRVGGLRAEESLVISADNTFKQVFDDQEDGLHFETQGLWNLEIRPSGCTYLHLAGMRYFYLTRQAAQNGNREGDNKELVKFWEPCEQQFVEMPDKVILLVTSHSDFRQGLALQYLKPSLDMTDILLEWSSP